MNMRPLPWTEDEILESYRRAADPSVQIKILAELNNTTGECIAEILCRHGLISKKTADGYKRKPRVFLTDTVTARKLYDQGRRDHEIARHLNVSTSAVTCWRKKCKLPSHGRREQETIDYTAVAGMYRRGLNDPQIAAALGISAGSVLLWRRRNGLPAIIKSKGEKSC